MWWFGAGRKKRKFGLTNLTQWPRLEAPSLPAGPGLSWLEQRPKFPFPTLKGNLKYVNNIRRDQEKRNENNWQSGGAACRKGAESAGGLLTCPARWWAWAAPSLFSWFFLLKDTQEWFQQNPMGAQIASRLQFSISMVVSINKEVLVKELSHREQCHGQT